MDAARIRKKAAPAIVRVVRLTIIEVNQPAFRRLFSETRAAILGARGCIDVRLLADTAAPDVLATFSLWASEADLNAYRTSEVFRSVWPRARQLFDAPAAAASFRITSPG